MRWPLPSDYAEALQYPKLSFADPELRAGQVATDRLGLPRPITGNFASVFRVQSGNRVWAVRCFLRDVPDSQRRYAAISQHLAHVQLPYMVDFVYQPKGIQLRGTWYPVVKMAWIAGTSLDDYVGRHLREPQRLAALAQEWRALAVTLRQARVAHGDLQHGNILVLGNGKTSGQSGAPQLKLIDYDGMFVPALAGEPSYELGHRNYQHPTRDERHFDESIDSFAAWTIYISLLALSARPELWRQLRGGDEALLLRRDDFLRPADSPAWQALGKLRDPRLDGLVTLYRSLLQLPLDQMPSLDELDSLAGKGHPAGAPRMTPGWLKDTTRPHGPGLARVAMPSTTGATAAGGAHAQPATQAAAARGSAWVFDHLAVAPAAQAAGGAAAMPIAAVAPAPAVMPAVAVPIAPVALPAPVVHPATAPAVAIATAAPPVYKLAFERFLVRLLLTILFASGGAASLQISQPGLALVALDMVVLADAVAALLVGLTLVARFHTIDFVRARYKLEHQARRLQKDMTRLNSSLAGLDDDLQRLDREERIEKERAHRAIENAADRYHSQRSDLTRGESEELVRALETLQELHVARALDKASLDRQPPAGIGAKMRLNLRAHGIRTAADVTLTKLAALRGIGPVRSILLINWRRSIESEARRSIPQSLEPAVERAIRENYARQLTTVEREGTDALRAAQQNLTTRTSRFVHDRAQLDQKRQSALQDHHQRSYALAQVIGGLGQYPAVSFGGYLAETLGLGWLLAPFAAVGARVPRPRWPRFPLPRLTRPSWTRFQLPQISPQARQRLGCTAMGALVLVLTCAGCACTLEIAYLLLNAPR